MHDSKPWSQLYQCQQNTWCNTLTYRLIVTYIPPSWRNIVVNNMIILTALWLWYRKVKNANELNTVVGQNIINCINYTDSLFYSTGYNIKYHPKAHNSFTELH